jgi:hypothetical protein
MASVTTFGTSYLPLSFYELVNGVMVPKAGAPTIASTPAAAASSGSDGVHYIHFSERPNTSRSVLSGSPWTHGIKGEGDSAECRTHR